MPKVTFKLRAFCAIWLAGYIDNDLLSKIN